MTRIGDAIAAARRERGWTRERLGERSGYARWCIKDIERGRRLPKETTAIELADALGASREDFASAWVVDKYNDAINRMRAAGGWTVDVVEFLDDLEGEHE